MLSIPLARSQILSNAPPLRFPQKLWKIANECESGAVSWSPHGRSILLRYSLFKEEFMSTKNDFFKTDNISSFVRQLNLYGFRKVYDHTHKQVYKANPDLHEFSNIYFQRDRPDLLDKVTRKLGALRDRNDFLLENQHPSLEEAEHFYDSKEAPKCSVGDENYKPDIRKDENPPEDKGQSCEDTSTTRTESQVKASVKTEPNVLQSLPGVSTNTPLEPVKKKRGRKPGSKSTTKQAKRIFSNATKYPLPTLRYPEVFSNLIHFDYDDGSVFLRNTSRDVMLSSTLPFQETPEYLELKEIYQRQYDFQQTSTSLLYSSLPVRIPYIKSVNAVDLKKKTISMIIQCF